ncbi:hypothetical protein Pelo_6227 [Pelomyxa schiedti]|nr:hypothetical protein Pelo_6227 [Pelomyxa schiedti]
MLYLCCPYFNCLCELLFMLVRQCKIFVHCCHFAAYNSSNCTSPPHTAWSTLSKPYIVHHSSCWLISGFYVTISWSCGALLQAGEMISTLRPTTQALTIMHPIIMPWLLLVFDVNGVLVEVSKMGALGQGAAISRMADGAAPGSQLVLTMWVRFQPAARGPFVFPVPIHIP